MKPSSIRKVFGIISYFPNNDTAYHIETRRERSRRFRELLFKLEELWSDVDIMVIAQNWQDFELPDIKNNIKVLHYGKLGILGARKELRKQFLASDYDYLIMLDDDFIIEANDPQAYMDEIDKHPDGFGALKRNPPSPLPFFAISKTIYSQIDLPDIDPEKGQGFEDDVFTAQCFAQFGDKSFIFPEGCVVDKSFHYDGPGKCPSSWSREHKYDWEYMRSNTRSIVHRIEHPETYEEPEPDAEANIDLLITYVNGSDQNWIKEYVKATHTHSPTPVRFRTWGTLKYLLRGVARYMPFIRKVVLIVASPSQVPDWVNREDVRIVYHSDFIPKQFLPTFNSCTIESFFWNIPDLTDRIIYFNDDMFPLSRLSENDFFTGDVPHFKFTEPAAYSSRAIFQSQCRSGIDMITKALGLPTFEEGKIVRPYHISAPISKSTLAKVAELCADTIPKTISMLRLTSNVNQYIYAYYHYFTNNYIDRVVDYKYFEIRDDNFKLIEEQIAQEGGCQMICLNDSDKIQNYSRTRYQLQLCFEKKFPDKCRYEA